MQGLWSNHRRSKLNLNSPASPGNSPAQTPVNEEPGSPTPALLDPPDISIPPTLTPPDGGASDPQSSTVNGKRKVRSSRTADSSSKRTKVSSASGTGAGGGGAIAKDHTPPTARLADLGGVDACVEKMLELVAMPLCHPEVYLHTGVQPPRGVLLHGPPGCGKTLLANAMAGVCAIQWHHMHGRSIYSRSSVYLSSTSQLHPSYPGCLESQKRHYEILSRRLRFVRRTFFLASAHVSTARGTMSTIHR